jgi:hypothetical protein
VRLHELIGSKRCVQVVICGHIHNFQSYREDVFATALSHITGTAATHDAPAYFVSGAGGAFLSVPPKQNVDYAWERVFPDRAEWERLTSRSFRQSVLARVRRAIAKVNLSQSVIDRALASVEEGALVDADKPALLSFLFLQIQRYSATITPVFLHDLSELYPSGVSAISIQNNHPAPDPIRVESCMQRQLEISF